MLERKIGRRNAKTGRQTFIAGMIYARKILDEKDSFEAKLLGSKNKLIHFYEKL